jgi:hypothetical protein
MTTLANQMHSNPQVGTDLWNLYRKIETDQTLDSSELSLLKSAIETEKLTHESGALDNLLLVVDDLLITEMRLAHGEIQAVIKILTSVQVQIHEFVVSDVDVGARTFKGSLVPTKDMQEMTNHLYNARSKLEGA